VSEDSPEQRGAGMWLGQLGWIVVLAAVMLWYVQARKAPARLLDQRDCERAYATALTRADTATVDSRRPITAPARADTLTCGALRKSGQVR
jgi:hypothetical protein